MLMIQTNLQAFHLLHHFVEFTLRDLVLLVGFLVLLFPLIALLLSTLDLALKLLSTHIGEAELFGSLLQTLVRRVKLLF